MCAHRVASFKVVKPVITETWTRLIRILSDLTENDSDIMWSKILSTTASCHGSGCCALYQRRSAARWTLKIAVVTSWYNEQSSLSSDNCTRCETNATRDRAYPTLNLRRDYFESLSSLWCFSPSSLFRYPRSTQLWIPYQSQWPWWVFRVPSRT